MDRRVRLRIRYDRRSGLVALLALALLVVAFVGYLAWNQDEVAASGPQAPLDSARDRPLASSAGMRRYYLTQSALYNGAEAGGTDGNGAGVCASGYHFASLWEIMDPSNLKYNTDLGQTEADSGQGPPSYLVSSSGWVRTGYMSFGSLPGQTNCLVWSTNSSSIEGTRARLSADWTAGGQDIQVWDVLTSPCNGPNRVWCVEDSVSVPVYLPLILKNSS